MCITWRSNETEAFINDIYRDNRDESPKCVETTLSSSDVFQLKKEERPIKLPKIPADDKKTSHKLIELPSLKKKTVEEINKKIKRDRRDESSDSGNSEDESEF